jgi:hypothetical protein
VAGAAPLRRGHFRSHARRAVRLTVEIMGQRSGLDRHASVVDVSLAGAGLETAESLVPGERLSIAFSTPTLWDPLVLPGVVTWAEAPKPRGELDALGRPRVVARAGVVFDYPDPTTTLAMHELLSTLGFE